MAGILVEDANVQIPVLCNAIGAAITDAAKQTAFNTECEQLMQAEDYPKLYSKLVDSTDVLFASDASEACTCPAAPTITARGFRDDEDERVAHNFVTFASPPPVQPSSVA